jgi:beta-glucosidase
VDERTLREIYLPQFEMIVKEAQPWTVMCAYNRLNDQYASQHNWLLNEVLRQEWGFQGAVISDWGANHTTVESIQGGLDLEMPGPARWYGGLLAEAVETWQIDEAKVNQAARRILRLVARAGRLHGAPLPEGSLNTPEHQLLARHLAAEAIVLLKNEQNLLPLVTDRLRSLAVLGPMAATGSIGGGGSSFLHPPYQVSPVEGLQACLDRSIEIHYAPGCSNSATDKDETDDISHAVELARRSDAALIFIGFPPGHESEGYDRPDIELTGRQNELVEAVLAANPRSVVVINAGSPVAMPWVNQAPAILLAHYPGQEGGHAMAKILLGEINPSGKLPVTWPVRLEDTPAYVNFPGERTVRYGEGIFVGYRYYDYRAIQPLFPFGHGLSYTEFSYGDLHAPAAAAIGDPIEISLTVTNSGSRPGKEVVQLYVSDLQASLPRPTRELKGFAKVHLAPGETKKISFTLEKRAFAFYNPVQGDWVVEPGIFEIHAASSSRDIRQAASIRLK